MNESPYRERLPREAVIKIQTKEWYLNNRYIYSVLLSNGIGWFVVGLIWLIFNLGSQWIANFITAGTLFIFYFSCTLRRRNKTIVKKVIQ